MKEKLNGLPDPAAGPPGESVRDRKAAERRVLVAFAEHMRGSVAVEIEKPPAFDVLDPTVSAMGGNAPTGRAPDYTPQPLPPPRLQGEGAVRISRARRRRIERAHRLAERAQRRRVANGGC